SINFSDVELEFIDDYAFCKAQIETGVLDFSRTQNLKKFGWGVFGGFKQKVILPSNLERLERGFSGFQGEVIFPSTLHYIGNSAFFEAQLSTPLVLPAILDTIGYEAFRGSNIGDITIPSGVKYIGTWAFANNINLSNIISENTTPPALGSSVFAGVDVSSCKLFVPQTAVSLYGTADQWKDFLNMQVSVPKEVDLTFEIDHQTYPYHGVRIGEYMWLDNNFYHPAPASINAIENSYPVTQATLDKYLPCANLDVSQFQINIDDFHKYYGMYYSPTTSDYMRTYGKMYENSNAEPSNWNLPTDADYQQLFAMCPFNQLLDHAGHTNLNERDVRMALGAHAGSNPLAFNIYDPMDGPYKTYWFMEGENINIYGFNLMPGGRMLNGNSRWYNNVGDGHDGVIGDVYHLFYAAGFRTMGQSVYIHDHVDTYETPYNWHWMNIRWCKRLSDQELGYKLYINSDYTDIIKLDLNDTPPQGYEELENGYLRGFYVQYILDKPNSTITVADIVDYARNVDDRFWSLPSKSPKIKATINGINKENIMVSISPNPVKNVLTVNSSETVISVKVFNLMGKVMVDSAVSDNSIDISHLTKGTYIVKVNTLNGIYTHKILKD
ncbi:MAG: leucine-rich repeat protein, partial [Dysgonomonas sp.]